VLLLLVALWLQQMAAELQLRRRLRLWLMGCWHLGTRGPQQLLLWFLLLGAPDLVWMQAALASP
jgi:hypothetical protein